MIRRAGRSGLPDGTQLIWSAADGRRGRRWRAALTRGEALISALLLEVGVDGRPVRLELVTAAGLLTLHPEGLTALHGNAVGRDGVRHLAFAWSEAHELDVTGHPITSAVTARRLAASIEVGEGRTLAALAVAADLSVRVAVRRFERVGDGAWRIESEGDARTLLIDRRGIPLATDRAEEWPLEREMHQ